MEEVKSLFVKFYSGLSSCFALQLKASQCSDDVEDPKISAARRSHDTDGGRSRPVSGERKVVYLPTYLPIYLFIYPFKVSL